MDVGLIRWVDRWLGEGACLFLTVVRRLKDWIASPVSSMHHPKPRKVLFIKWIEQGATILAYDAIHEAVHQVGRENVYFCVFRENAEIMEILELIPKSNILMLRRDSIFIFMVDALRTLSKLRRLGIDATVDMEFFARGTALFAFLSGARDRVGLHRFTSESPFRGDLLTHRVQYNPHLHVAQSYRLLVDALFDEDPRRSPLQGRRPVSSSTQLPPAFSPGPFWAAVIAKSF